MEFGSEGAPAKTVGEEGKARDEEEREGQGYEGRYVLLMTKDECEEAIVEAGRKDEAERLVEAADWEKREVQRGWTEWLLKYEEGPWDDCRGQWFTGGQESQGGTGEGQEGVEEVGGCTRETGEGEAEN